LACLWFFVLKASLLIIQQQSPNMAAHHFPLWCSKFHCCNLDAKHSALFFWKFEILDEVIELALCDLMIGGVCAWQVVCISWSCCSSLFDKTLSSSSEYIAKLSGGSGKGSPASWGTDLIADGIFGNTSVDFFFMDIPFWVGDTIQKLQSVLWLLGTLQTMGTSNGKQRPFPFTYALSLDEHVVQHTCGANFLSLSPTLQPKYKKYAFFNCWNSRTLPWGKCHFSANTAEVIRLIYALLGHFDKYTTQYMTADCQLKLSRHNSHERTWGHYLQYDRFRTTLNKNWRELTVNNFIDHVTNTCSDDSRSCDFVVVWELRRPLRVLPTYEDGDLIFSWKKWNFRP